MTIRQATVEDLPRLSDCASKFFASSKFLNNFNLEHFCKVWTAFLESEIGVIFVLCDGDAIVGTLGGIATPDINSGEMVASELYWFVDPEHRGGSGVRLYLKFEQWAKGRGCSKIMMIHLSDSMPETVKGMYLRLGFEYVEALYAKPLT